MKYEKRLDLSNNRHHDLYWKNDLEYKNNPNYDSLTKIYYHSLVLDAQHNMKRILTRAERKRIYIRAMKSY